MEMYRKHPDPAVRRRAHIVLLLADGRSWSFIESALYCSRRTIDRWKRRFQAGGIEALLGERPGRRSWYGRWLMTLVVTWVTTRFPRDFGFVRSRWTCECLAILVLELAALRVSRETVRRWLHQHSCSAWVGNRAETESPPCGVKGRFSKRNHPAGNGL
jgi:transposase